MSITARFAGMVAAGALAAVVVALTVHVLARWFGVPIVGGAAVAQLAFVWLGISGLLVFAAANDSPETRWRGALFGLVLAFGAVRLGLGALEAARIIGGVEAVTGLPQWVRFAGVVALSGLACIVAAFASWRRAVAVAVGAGLALALPAQPIAIAAAAFAGLIAVRCPPAVALLFAGALADFGLSDAAFAQTVVRGLTLSVLLAVPLFILAASCLMASGLAAELVGLAKHLTRRRATGVGEANVLASALFGGFSGSSLADAALGGRLMVPAMVGAGYPAPNAVALTASASLLPNLLPPSIALLLAAAITNQSVASLWLAGIGAGLTLGAVLWAAVRFMPPPTADAPMESGSTRPRWLAALAPLAGIAAILLGLRTGLVTATEAGLLAVAAAGAHGLFARGLAAMGNALVSAAEQTARIALLIGAVAPLTFAIATSGLDVPSLLGGADGWWAALAVFAIALGAGTVLDVGAGILLLLPLLLPALTEAGVHPVQGTVALVMVLLAGGLTPPVGILVLTVADVSGERPAWRATLPYLALIVLAAFLILLLPPLTLWLPAQL